MSADDLAGISSLPVSLAQQSQDATNTVVLKKKKKILDEIFANVTLMKAITDTIPSQDPLDQSEFNRVDYINAMFPDEASLEKIDEEALKLKRRVLKLDEDIIDAVARQSRAGTRGKQEIDRANNAVSQLFQRIQDIKKKADESEKMVQNLCQDIRDLDFARKNLTSSISTIKRLHDVSTSLEQLRGLAENKQYREVGNLLTGIVDMLSRFQEYHGIDRIKELTWKLNNLKADLKKMAFFEFDYLPPPNEIPQATLTVLGNCCWTIDALGEEVRNEFIGYFTGKQLAPYFKDFKEGNDLAKLEYTDKRFEWLRAYLKLYDKVFGTVFPPGWRMNEFITEEFCIQTREQLIEQLERTKDYLDVSALKKALIHTLKMERDLILHFSNALAPQQNKAKLHHRRQRSTVDLDDMDDGESHSFKNIKIPPEMLRFKGMVSIAFDAYMYLYIEHQDRLLKSTIEQLLMEETWKINEDDDDDSKILLSSIHLISSFDEARKSMANLNQNQAFLDLFKLFQKYLGEYATALKDKMSASSPTNFTLNDEKLCCLIVNTADYCGKMTKKIEEFIMDEISDKFKDKIDMQAEEDLYQEVVGKAVNLLIKFVEHKLASVFQEMTATRWDLFENTVEVSSFVEKLSGVLQEKFQFFRWWMKSPEYFQYLCDSFVGWFLPRFRTAVFDCKKFSEIGAEQLSSDVGQIKRVLEELPVVGRPNDAASEVYLKRVRRGMDEVDKFLKLLRTPNEVLVDSYKSLFYEDHSERIFAKILALKGLKYAEQEQLLIQYGSKQPAEMIQVGVGERLGSLFDDLDASKTAEKLKKLFSIQ